MLFITTIKNKNIKNYLQVANDIIDHTTVINWTHIELVYKAVIYMSKKPITITVQKNWQHLFEYDKTNA